VIAAEWLLPTTTLPLAHVAPLNAGRTRPTHQGVNIWTTIGFHNMTHNNCKQTH